jgi:hypothetical protein
MYPRYCLNDVESGASFAVLYPVVEMGSFVIAEEAGKVSLIGSLLPAFFACQRSFALQCHALIHPKNAVHVVHSTCTTCTRIRATHLISTTSQCARFVHNVHVTPKTLRGDVSPKFQVRERLALLLRPQYRLSISGCCCTALCIIRRA